MSVMQTGPILHASTPMHGNSLLNNTLCVPNIQRSQPLVNNTMSTVVVIQAMSSIYISTFYHFYV